MFNADVVRFTASIVFIVFTSYAFNPRPARAETPYPTNRSFQGPGPAGVTPPFWSSASNNVTPGDPGRLSKALASVSDKLKRPERGPSGNGSNKQVASELDAVRRELAAADTAALEDLDRMERSLLEQKAPLAFLVRHTAAVNQYKTQMAELRSALDGVSAARNATERERQFEKARRLLETVPKKHTRLDPNRLAFRSQDGKARKPYGSQKELQTRFLSRLPSTKTAGKTAVASTTPPELGATEDVQFSGDIQALALTLEHNPVKIYNWVYNNIEFIPTYGSVQGSQMTLISKRGNAFDIASLLIALLRTSNIPARYVYGTIQIPVDKVMNWTGATAPTEVQDILSLGGIPSVAVLEGGKIASIRLEHVWAEAYVDFVPSRGAINREGDTWVPMDAAFKQYQLTPGMNLPQSVPFDAQAFADHVRSTAQVNEQEGWVTRIDQSYVQSTLTTYRDRILAYIHSTHPDATVGDVIGKKVISPMTFPMLTDSLPYQTVAIGTRFTSLPEALRHKVTLKLYATEMDRGLDSPDISFTLSLPALNSQRLAITYAPASPADAQLIDSYVAQGATSLPAYLIHVKPLIQVNGSTVATGSTVTMGQPHYWDMTLVDPQGIGTGTDSYDITAGDEIVVGIDGNGISPAVVQQRLDTSETGNASDNLHQVALHYWMEYDLFDDIAARNHHVYKQRLPSAGFFSSPLTVSYWFGIPRSASYRGRQMDVKRALLGVTAPNKAAKVNFVSQSGMQGSYLEGTVFDQLFHHPQGKAVSAAQLVMDASLSGIPIYTITQANLAQALPQLGVSSSVKSDIVAAVNAGKRAIVPKQEAAKGGWSGAGYIIQDPETGAGAYLIDGGLNGASSPACVGSAVPAVSPVALGVMALFLAALITEAAGAVTLGVAVTTAGTLVFVASGPILALVAFSLAFILVATLFMMMLLDLSASGGMYASPYVDECDCTANVKECLGSRLADIPGRCHDCLRYCQGQGSWQNLGGGGTCAYWNY